MEKLIFDIGANHGKWIGANYNAEYKFVGVEANPILCDSMKRGFVQYKNIVIENYLMSDKSGEQLDFFVSKDHDQISTASTDWINKSRFAIKHKWHDPIKVESITLDDLIKKYGDPEWIKIDVEGYEFVVLKGLSKNVKLLSFEWTEEQNDVVLSCIDHCHNIGFTEFFCLKEDKFNFKPTTYTPYDQFREDMIKIMIPERKVLSGMIYCK